MSNTHRLSIIDKSLSSASPRSFRITHSAFPNTTMAFITGPVLPTTTRSKTASHATVCSASPQRRPVSRRDLLSGAAAVLSAAVFAPKDASAADFQSAVSKALFPKQGFNAPDLLPTSKVVLDRDILSQKEATAALKTLHGYETAISELYARFKSDPQIELSGSVKSMISISDLRNALNIVNEAIDEESQIETDKVVRGIIQDIGELEMAGALKTGVARTTKKIERTTDWFDKLKGDFSRLLAFYS